MADSRDALSKNLKWSPNPLLKKLSVQTRKQKHKLLLSSTLVLSAKGSSASSRKHLEGILPFLNSGNNSLLDTPSLDPGRNLLNAGCVWKAKALSWTVGTGPGRQMSQSPRLVSTWRRRQAETTALKGVKKGREKLSFLFHPEFVVIGVCTQAIIFWADSRNNS